MSTHPATCLIPLTSSEPLWEWDIVSDTLFLSLGACSLLRLPEPPTRMADFLGHIPPHALPRLNELREGVLSGMTGSSLECDYPFSNLWLQEQLLVLARCENGRATRVMGRYTVAPDPADKADAAAGARQNGLPDVGVWIYSITSKSVWRDSTCAALLGAPAPEGCSIGYDSRLSNIHPADKKALAQRYRLLIEQKSQGDTRDDIIKVLLGNGRYARMLLRGSVLERDDLGRATLLAGTLQRAESAQPFAARIPRDGRLYYALDAVGDGLWDWDLRDGVEVVVEVEVLDARADVQDVALRVRLAEDALEAGARVALERLARGRLDVAEHARDALLLWPPRQNLEGCGVREGEHVRLLGRDEALHGRAIEADALLERLLQVLGGNREALEFAHDVREPKTHEADVALLYRP